MYRYPDKKLSAFVLFCLTKSEHIPTNRLIKTQNVSYFYSHLVHPRPCGGFFVLGHLS